MPRYIRYISAVDAAEMIAKKLNVEMFDLVDVLADVPTADVQDVVHSQWDKSDHIDLIPDDKGKFEVTHKYTCINCGWSFNSVGEAGLKYCPECGGENVMRASIKPSKEKIDRLEQAVFDSTVMACQDNNAMFLLALNSEFGFGAERLERMVRKYNEISEYYTKLKQDGLEYEDVVERICDALRSIGVQPEKVYTGRNDFYEIRRQNKLIAESHKPTFAESVEVKQKLDAMKQFMKDNNAKYNTSAVNVLKQG